MNHKREWTFSGRAGMRRDSFLLVNECSIAERCQPWSLQSNIASNHLCRVDSSSACSYPTTSPMGSARALEGSWVSMANHFLLSAKDAGMGCDASWCDGGCDSNIGSTDLRGWLRTQGSTLSPAPQGNSFETCCCNETA